MKIQFYTNEEKKESTWFNSWEI